MKYLTSGNKKIHKSIGIFNLPPIVSCPNCDSCKDTCYARINYKRYPNNKAKYDYNYTMSRDNPQRLEADLVNELSLYTYKTIRVHASGDFWSQRYVDMWHSVASQLPDIRFFGMTKTIGLFNFECIDNLPNFNIINSFINGWLNYGDMEYITNLKAHNPVAHICQATINPSIHCGLQCEYCITEKYPVFKIH